jgi:hypothetical protein
MKILIVICIVVLLLQFGALGLSFGTGDVDRPTEEQIEDEEWHPEEEFPTTARFERLLDPFRPRLVLQHWEQQQKSFAAGITEPVSFENGHEDRRVAKFELTSGTGILIRYECSRIGQGYRCPQVTCLCPAGAAINLADFSDCGRSQPDANICPTDGGGGEIVVYSEKGTLLFSGLGAGGGTVRQR